MNEFGTVLLEKVFAWVPRRYLRIDLDVSAYDYTGFEGTRNRVREKGS